MSTKKDQIKSEFKDAFDRADTDKSGVLTKEQVSLMLGTSDVEVDPKHLQRLFNFMDLDRNGTVDLDEFADAMMALEELSFGFTIMRMRFLFNRYDVNGSGVITRDNLIQLAKSDPTFDLDAELLEGFMKKCDINGDGEISFDEFAKVMGGAEG